MAEDSQSELAGYLQEVNEELRRREARVSSLLQELEEIKFKLEQAKTRGYLMSGDAGLIVQGEIYKKTLVENISEKSRLLEEATQDLKSAQERKAQVELEMEQAK